MQKNQIKAVIFDADGVLLNGTDESGRYLWGKNAATDLGLRSAHFQQIYSPAWEHVTRGTLPTKEHLAAVFATELFSGLNLTPERYLEYWFTRDRFINTEVYTLATNLQIPAYIGTNQEAHRTAHIKSMIGPGFTDVFASYALGAIKPDAQFYAAIEKKLVLAGPELLLIDDTAANVQAARARGWQAFHYTGNTQALKDILTELSAYSANCSRMR